MTCIGNEGVESDHLDTLTKYKWTSIYMARQIETNHLQAGQTEK